MFRIIKCPIFTEKTVHLLEKNKQYVFDVDSNLTRLQVRFLIEKRFLVRILAVNVHCVPLKKRRGSILNGFLLIFKRIIVTLVEKKETIFFLELLVYFHFFYEFALFSFYKFWNSTYYFGFV